MKIENSEYIFSPQGTSYITLGIFKSVLLLWIFGGLCIDLYFSHPHIVAWVFAAFLILFPIPFLYCRWKLFEYNKYSSLSINLGSGKFTYIHKDKVHTFDSIDIEEWMYHMYGTTLTDYVLIITLRLKTGEEIFISSGIGDIEKLRYLMYQNRAKLALPEEEIGYSLKYLYEYLEKTVLLLAL
jgi:hypothetical protein